MTLKLASQNDQFATVLAAIAPKFKALTGAKVKVDIMSYPELLTKITADFVGHTKGYDLVTMDIVWSGQFAEAGYTVDLTDWIKRDAAEIKVDDIYPSLMASLGGYKGKQVAFPFAGYANVLAYRKDLYKAAGLKPPETMEEMVADALKLTDKSKKSTASSPTARRARRWRRTGCSTIARWAARSSARTASRRSIRPPTSRASSSTRSCSTRPRLPAPPTMTGAAARRASARGWSPRCRPGRSAPPTMAIRKCRRSPARRGSC